MKKIILGCLITLGLSSSLIGNNLTLTIENKSSKGSIVLLELFDNAADYEAPLEEMSLPLYGLHIGDLKEGDKITIAAGSFPNGEYVYRWFLDENDNAIFDVDPLGAPKEKFGFSKPNPKLGTPSFVDVKFVLNKDTKHHIVIR